MVKQVIFIILFDTIVKNKYILEISENQNVLINFINYLNNTAFSINNEVLNFILDNGLMKIVIIFKGANKL